jgi:LysM repeat protein
MTINSLKPPEKTCPTCGTLVSENATRCLVCGRPFTVSDKQKKSIQGPKMPEITLSLPIALGLMVLVLAIGAVVVFALLNSTGRVVEPTQVPTITETPTLTLTPTASLTPTPFPTGTPLPPLEYSIQSGDFCSTIAAFFNVSVQSIVLLNNLPADCGTLIVGQILLIPQPTPTASPQPSSTLSEAQSTEDACEKLPYVVGENDTLSGIARNYNISMDILKEYNAKSSDVVFQGETIMIPLCQRLPTPGPTPTATPPPPYAAPSLLLPADGSPFLGANDTITLQWASVGTLRENETYQVNIEDVTDGTGRKLVSNVTDTKFTIPASFRPNTSLPHILRWWVTPMRQTGSTKDGQPIWAPAGAASAPRVFTWQGINVVTPTP